MQNIGTHLFRSCNWKVKSIYQSINESILTEFLKNEKQGSYIVPIFMENRLTELKFLT